MSSGPTQPIPKKSALIKTDRPRPHVCATCTRAFARLEHLKRHERSHTNEKPFQCAACGRCFARRDLVLRHQQKLHAGLISADAPEVTIAPVAKGATRGRSKNYNSNIIEHKNNTDKIKPLPGQQMVQAPSVISTNPTSSTNIFQSQNKSASGSPESVSSSPVDSNPFSPGNSTLNSMSRTATNDGIPMGLSSSVSNMNPPNLMPLRKINSGPAGPVRSVVVNNGLPDNDAEMANGPVDLQDNSDDLLASFQMFGSKPHHRHASFSATSASSYTLPTEAKVIHDHDPVPEAPHQVGFSTPQLSATELASKALMTGLDVDSLPLDWEALENFSLSEHGTNHNNQAQSNGNSHYQFDFELPIYQDFLLSGGAGGGAGFDEQQEVKKEKDKEILQENWLDEFIKTPFDTNIDINHIGFSESKEKDAAMPKAKRPITRVTKVKKEKLPRMAQTDIPSLFRDRQLDLFQEESSAVSPNSMKPLQSVQMSKSGSNTASNISNSSFLSKLPMQSSYQSDYKFDFFTVEIRNHIISSNNLAENQFPSIGELNSYIFLYCKEFDNYFPFVHLPSIESSIHNIPLLLAVAAIGALYSFHSSNSLLLFGVSKFYIHNFLESNKNFQHDDIPLWLIQCLTLNMFLGIFNNDESLNKSIAKQLNSLVFLVKKCSLHLSLEQFLSPPPVLGNTDANGTPMVLKSNFDYFILAQSRIRTVHTILLISVLFDTLIGAPIVLHSEDIKCGSPCFNEALWKVSNYQKWFQLLVNDNIVLDSKFTLISLSNGENFSELIHSLVNHNYMDLINRKVDLKIMLSLLMYVHQSIYEKRVEVQKTVPNKELLAMTWRMKERMDLEALLKYWELLFIKSEGILIPNKSNLELINKSPILKLILPLLSFAKIRLCLSVTPILEKVWIKDWEGMNEELSLIESDAEALRESSKYSLNIIELWIDLISVHNDAQKTSRKTPIFFLTCTFTSILFLSEYLYTVENLANSYFENAGVWPVPKRNVLTAVDTALFVRVSNVLKKVSTTLTPDNPNNRTFAEFLKMQANGALDFDNISERAENSISPSSPNRRDSMEELIKFIRGSRLSSKCLYLGIRILADAPIWPAAVLFAEALKARSMAISRTSEGTPNSSIGSV